MTQKPNNVQPIQPNVQQNGLTNKKRLTPDFIKFKAQGIKKIHQEVINALNSNKSTILEGCAGVGKTFLLLNIALQKVANKEYRKVVILRSNVSVRDSGFLPGTEEEKNAPFEEPYQMIVLETLDSQSLEDYYTLKDKMKVLEFRSTRFNQGITLRDSFIIVDEAQNMKYEELYNIFTRQGEGCSIHFCGDYKKQDFLPKKEKSGFKKFIEVLSQSEELNKKFEKFYFEPEDVVRSGIVKDFIKADYYFDHDNFDKNNS